MSNVLSKSVKKYFNVTQFKVFKSSEAMYKFLNSQTNNDWSVSNAPVKKSGKYIRMGKEFVNIKSFDRDQLPHMLSPRY